MALPDQPSLEWLRKQAKRRLAELRESQPDARLADAQFALAKDHGFASWRALKAHIDSLGIDGQLFDAAKRGDVATLTRILDTHPEKLLVRDQPHEWSLLHHAAASGSLAAVDLLLRRGLDVNTREKGDNTYAMHWAAAAAHLDVIRRLADAGGDVTGRGDDHGLEVIGWATCWDGADDGAHREAAEFLVSRGARHHIFSAIALNLAGEVRRIVAADPTALNRRMSRHEGSRLPLHFAVSKNRREMAALLLELGADPLGADEAGYPATTYATSLESDRPVLERIRELTAAELLSADRGSRPTRGRDVDLLATVSLGDWPAAERLLHDSPRLASSGVLHLLAKRNDLTGARWLLERGADPNARWNHWDALVTPLHLAILGGHAEMTRLLLDAGADPTIRDDKHDADALDWAGFFRRDEIVELLKQRSSA